MSLNVCQRAGIEHTGKGFRVPVSAASTSSNTPSRTMNVLPDRLLRQDNHKSAPCRIAHIVQPFLDGYCCGKGGGSQQIVSQP